MLFAYFTCLVLRLEIPAEVIIKEDTRCSGRDNKFIAKYTKSFKMSIAWTSVLVIGAIFLFYTTRNYRKHYFFNCGSYYVEANKGIYHIFEECEDMEYDNVQYIEGYKIGEDIVCCKTCYDIAEEYDYNVEPFGYK